MVTVWATWSRQVGVEWAIRPRLRVASGWVVVRGVGAEQAAVCDFPSFSPSFPPSFFPPPSYSITVLPDCSATLVVVYSSPPSFFFLGINAFPLSFL